MPTARGWLIALAGLGLWIGGRILGASPLEQMGFGLVVLVFAAVAVLRLGRHDLRVTRAITPQKVTAGREVQVGLRIDNLGEGPTPLVLIEDRVAAELGNRARFVMDGIRPGDRRQGRYVLRPRRRGKWQVGPLQTVFRDPFGVARIRATVGASTDFLVFPRIERLTLPEFPATRRSPARSARRELTGTKGEDFYTLREYVEGDDLRRIHWPATAKRDRYMIRQEETPWQTRATVLLDDRLPGYSRVTWERALEATASLVDLFLRSGYTLTLTATQSAGDRAGKGTSHLHRCLERLVLLEPTRPAVTPDDPDPLLLKLGAFAAGASAGEILVTLAANIDGATAQGLVRAASSARAAAAIVLEDETTARRERTDEQAERFVALEAAGIRVLRLPVSAPLAPRWEALWSRTHRSPEPRGGDRWEPKRAPV